MSQDISTRVQQALKRMRLRYVQVSAGSTGGVILSGTVGNHDERTLASAIARTTPGGTSITNQIVVRS
ncbi:BON domain-containing protein [Novipirellula aureliae]|uniref:BON domain-containing protein n=1 Tax=Novipirellula aureliae TaxID=2527966 RepID=UPI0011B4DF63